MIIPALTVVLAIESRHSHKDRCFATEEDILGKGARSIGGILIERLASLERAPMIKIPAQAGLSIN